MMKLINKVQQLSYKTLITIFVALLAIVALLAFYKGAKKTEAAWFNDSWLYRTALTFTNTGAAVTNQKVKFDIDTATLYTAGKIQIDCDDSRFTDANGNLLDYYLDSAGGACNTNSTDYWVLVPTISAGSNLIYHYYGNPSATKGSVASQFSQATFTQGATSAASEEQSPGPVAYWKFDEGTGTTANDSTQNKNNGSLGTGSSAPTWQTEDMCVSGKCLKFDGGDDIDISNFSNTTQTYTFSFWAKSSVLNTTYQYIFDSQTGRLAVAWFTSTSGQIGFYDASGSWRNFGQAPNDGKWHNVALVLNASNSTGVMYIDGSKFGNTASYTATSIGVSTAIGSRYSKDQYYFSGFLDEVKIYPYARSAAQIKSDYNAGKGKAGTAKGSAVHLGGGGDSSEVGGFSQGLVGYWKMDEASWNGTANEVVDSSGNANHGVGVGSTKPTTGAGKFGNGGVFNGINNYVALTQNSNLPISSTINYTIAFWVKGNSAAANSQVYAEGNSTTTAPLFEIGVPSSGTGVRVFLRNDLGSSGSYDQTSTTAVFNNTWHYVVFTDNSSTGIIYVDGKLDTSANYTRSSTYTFNLSSIGALVRTSASSWFAGSVDDLRIYNRALSPAEVRQLYDWAPGPVGYWDFEEGTGGTVADSSGNNNNGSWSGTGTTHWTTGKIGKAGKFSSSNGDYVNAGDPASGILDFGTNNFTACAWINHAGGTNYERVLEKGAYNSTIGWEIAKGNQDNNYSLILGFYTDSSKTRQVQSSAIYKKNTWYYVCMVVNRASTYSLYVNGVFITSGDISAIPTETVSNDRSLYISQSGGNKWNGSIDDVRIYNYARSQKQIVEDMNAGHPAVGSPVGSAVGYWKFDEGYGTNANNSGNGGSALNGTFGTGTAAPAWNNNGKFGKALGFDGSNDIVTVTDNSSLHFSSGMSAEAWIKVDSWTAENIYGGIVDKHSGCGGTNYNSFRLSLSNKKPSWWGKLSNGDEIFNISGLSDLQTGSWHHIVGTYNGTAARLYLDSIEVATNNSVSGVIGNGGTLRIGMQSCNWNFGGSIDEVKIYNYALTEDEVKLDYNRGSSMVLGTLSDTSGLTGGSVASQSASAEYCIPGDTTTCNAPVGRWDFEEGQGTTTQDSSGNGNLGTFGATTAAPSWTTGKIGKALKFDGSNDYVITPLTLYGASAVSYSVWVKPNSLTTQGKVVGSDGWGNDLLRLLCLFNSGYYRFSLRWGSATTYDLYYSVKSLEWTHLTAVADIPNKASYLYVNGKLVDSKTNIDSFGTFAPTQPQSIGRDYSGINYFNGLIDQVRIFNYARTPAQVAWDYNRGKPVAQYKFDECQGTTIHSSNDPYNSSLNGTLTIGTSGSNPPNQNSAGTCTDGLTTSAWYNGASGKYNASLKFDGVDDYTQVTDTANLRFNESTIDFSLFAWTKRTTTGTEYIISKEDADNDGYRLMFNSSNQVLCSEDATDVTSTSTITDTNWHLIGCTIDRDANGQIYIDGRADGSAVAMGTDAMATTANIRIGTRSYTSANWFNGLIDDVKIFNYGLTATQVKTLYNDGAVHFGPVSGNP